MNELVERLGWVLVHSLWQFALLALMAGVISRAMRQSSSAARYGVHVVVMGVMVVVPLMTWLVLSDTPRDDLASRAALAPEHEAIPKNNPGTDAARLTSVTTFEAPTPDDTTSTRRARDVSPPVMKTSLNSETTGGLTPPARQETLSWSQRAKTALQPWLTWIVAVWCIGVAVCSLRPLLGWHMLWRLKRVGVSPVSEDVLASMRRLSERLRLRHAVSVLQSTLAQVPVVVGYLRPVILLPVSLMTSLPTEQLEAILAHELAHVRRHDFVVNLLQTLVETFFFYHPAVWWLSHQIRVEREHCCDDLVVASFGNRIEYGRALLAIEELRGRSTVLALGAADGSLLARIRRIVGAGADRTPGSWSSVVVTLSVFIAIAATFIGLRAHDLPQESRLLVQLPNGATVRLLGVCEDPVTMKTWWAPNGGPLVESVGDARFTSPESRLPPLSYGFAISIDDLPSNDRILALLNDAPTNGSFGFGNGNDPPAGRVNVSGRLHNQVEKWHQTANLGVLLTDGDWEPWWRVELDGQIKPVQVSPDARLLYEAFCVENIAREKVEITYSLPNEQQLQGEFQFRGIARDGQPPNGGRGSGAGGVARQTHKAEFRVSREDFSHFEFRFRPYHYRVSFRNVSLSSAHRTTVVADVVRLGVTDTKAEDRERFQTLVRLKQLATNFNTNADVEQLEQRSRPVIDQRIEQTIRRADIWGIKAEAWPLLAQLKTLEELRFNACDLRGETLKVLAGLPRLRRVEISGSELSLDELEHIGQCAALEEIDIVFKDFRPTDRDEDKLLGKLSDAEETWLDRWIASRPNDADARWKGIAAIRGERSFAKFVPMPNLRRLKVANTFFTGQSTKSLRYMRSLQDIDLPLLHLEYDDVTALWGNSNLRSLRSAEVANDDSLTGFKYMRQIKMLDVWAGQVTDRGICLLSEAKTFHDLSLRGSQITDAGLDALSELPHLQRLDLRLGKNPLSDQAIERFRERLPKCQLIRVGDDTTTEQKHVGRESSDFAPIEGQVIDAVTGKLIDGATVRFRFRKLSSLPIRDEKPLAELVFRNVGKFTFELSDAVKGQTDLFVERVAEHPDYQSLGATGQGFYFLSKAEPNHARDFIRQVKMVPGKVVSGRVLDLNGQPAKGVAVTSGFNREGWQNGNAHKTTTDANGRYRLVVPESSGRGRIYVIPTHAAAVSRAITPEFGEQPVFQLLRGTRLFGRVTDAKGRGVANVVVRADGSDRVPLRHAMTDADGRYSLPPCQYGKYVVELYDEGRFPELSKDGVRLPDVYLHQVVDLPKTAPAQQQLDFKPTESVRMTARYTTSDDQPVCGRSLSLMGVANKVGWWGRLREVTDQPGLYELRVPRGFEGRINQNSDDGFLRITREAADGKSVPERYVTKFDEDGLAFHVVRLKPSSVTLRPTFNGKPVKPTGPLNFPQFADSNAAQQIGARLPTSQARTPDDDKLWFDVHPNIDLLLKLNIPGFKPWQETVQIKEGEDRVIDVPLESD